MVLELVICSSADVVCRCRLAADGKPDAPSDAQGPSKDSCEGELKLSCELLWGEKEDEPGQHKPGE